ncbi:MAG: hypothetical protein HY698_15845 [Deltaproteobacteria bacterium]|nr:hypothetical protein [Deltaproteobacteria bacterium]
MKKLSLTALALCAVTQATGCIILSDDDPVGGRFQVSWSLTQGGAPVTCESVGADYFSVLSTLQGTTTGYDDLFDCVGSAGTSKTSALPIGTYTVLVSINDDRGTDNRSDDDILGQTDPITKSIEFDGQSVPLTQSPIAFAFAPPTGNVTFSVDYGTQVGGSCAESGVIQQQIRLLGNNQCFAVGIKAGANTGKACENMICVEDEVTQTLEDVPNGTYTLEIYGLKGAQDSSTDVCYRNSKAPKQVTVSSADQNLGVIMVEWNPLPADDADCNRSKPASER